MYTLHGRPLLALVSDERNRAPVLHCAEMIAKSSGARLHVFDEGATGGGAADAPVAAPWAARQPASALEAAERYALRRRPGMIVADWPDAAGVQPVLKLAITLNVPGVFVRWRPGDEVRRVLIPTAGGANTLQQVWYANEIATARGIPAQLLRILHEDPRLPDEDGHRSEAAALARVQARAMKVPAPVEFCVAQDVVEEIAAHVRPGDLVILGAPNYWRGAEHFEGSIPDLVAKRVPNPVVMLLSRRAQEMRLRDILWDRMVRLNMEPRDKAEAIEALVDTLVRQNQVPHAWRDVLAERAISREAVMSTAVGCETAFPHITLRDFTGVIGCLGICPKGVLFDEEAGQPVKFVFLLVTPEDFYGEYLGVLAKIAELMVHPEVRERLLQCESPGQVLDVLDPLEE